MAYACKIWIKDECDGCGLCENEDERPMLYGDRRPLFDDDTYNPFEMDYDDER